MKKKHSINSVLLRDKKKEGICHEYIILFIF